MILTVTLNPALDVTYRVPRVELHASHRVREVTQLAGGKGVNVASVLHQRGLQVVATGLLGGLAGEQVRADLDARGIAHDFASCGGQTRRSVSVVSEADGDATVFNEPGPAVRPGDWQAFETHLGVLLQRLRPAVVVVSGSLPPGAPADACGRVVAAARAGGARTVVDTSGPALLEALAAGPEVVKPNREELAAATGERDPVEGARLLQRSGAREVLVSAGADGLVLVEPAGAVTRAWLAEPLSGNPTGAGDAAVAALAAGLGLGRAPRDTLRDAVAWSAAAVLHPVAGHIRTADVDRLLPMVRIERGQRATPRATPRAIPQPTPQPTPRPTLQPTPPEEASHADPTA